MIYKITERGGKRMPGNKYENLCKTAAKLDDKIARQINGGRELFINASYPSALPYYDYLTELRDNGFDNYPVVNIKNPDAIFFMEKIIGCEMRYTEGKNDFFHTFCVPVIKSAGDIDKINTDLDNNPVWNNYCERIRAHSVSPEAVLPVSLPAFCPLDNACAIMGPGEFLTLLADDINGAMHIIGFISGLYMEMVTRIKKSNVKTKDPNGYPGTYASDLNTMNISPKMLEKIIPFYEKTANFAGGMTLGIAVSDISLMKDIVSVPPFYGFSFDSRLKLEDISKILGKKLFIIDNHIYDDELNGVTLKNGIYVNPIVSSHSRNITEVFREFSDSHSIMGTIYRYNKQEAVDVLNILKK